MSAARSLTSYRCLTFDCFGTLIDWETGVYRALSPLESRLSPSHPSNSRLALLRLFIQAENDIQSANPAANYQTVLAETYLSLAASLGLPAPPVSEAETFSRAIGSWCAFDDTVAALLRLKKHFKLVILSNVDRESFSHTLAGPLKDVEFDAVYTAQDIGSYKPDPRNFEYLIDHCKDDLGVAKQEIVHTAYSLFHDLVPARKVGLAAAWIERGAGVVSVMGGDYESLADELELSWRFATLGDMADAAEAAFSHA